jgi:hypothetical protein
MAASANVSATVPDVNQPHELTPAPLRALGAALATREGVQILWSFEEKPDPRVGCRLTITEGASIVTCIYDTKLTRFEVFDFEKAWSHFPRTLEAAHACVVEIFARLERARREDQARLLDRGPDWQREAPPSVPPTFARIADAIRARAFSEVHLLWQRGREGWDSVLVAIGGGAECECRYSLTEAKWLVLESGKIAARTSTPEETADAIRGVLEHRRGS